MTQETLSQIVGKDIARRALPKGQTCALSTVYTETIGKTVCGLAEYSFADGRVYAVRANFHPMKQGKTEGDMYHFFRQIERLHNEHQYRRFSFVVFAVANECDIWDFDAYITSSDYVWGERIDDAR